MGVSRRDFLKLTGATAVAGAVGGAGEAQALERENRLNGATKTTSICPYCAVGCGMLVYQKDGKVIQIEGDPEHPINQGSLCPKGASVMQLVNNRRASPSRNTAPRARPSGRTSSGRGPSTRSPSASRRPATPPSSRRTTRGRR